MDEFEYYCQLAGSSASKPDNKFFLDPNESESSRRVRSHSLLPIESRTADQEEIYNYENRRDSLQHPNFRTRSMNANRQNPDNLSDNNDSNQSLYRVRSLKKTSKGVINKGDSLRTHSNTSLEKEDSYAYPCSEFHADLYPVGKVKSKTSNIKSLDVKPQKHDRESYQSRENSNIHWHMSCKSKGNKMTCLGIQVLGAPLVGKSSMCDQFLTSEYLGNSDNRDKGNESKSVTIDLDGEEYNLTFLDTVKDEDFDPNTIRIIHDADGFMVVYAIDEYDSFEFAKTILKHLRKDASPSSALFLVANKSDLERGREISSEDGKHLAKTYDCQFLEISTALNHMVDDLLVKIIHRICQQREKFKEKKEESFPDRKHKTRTNTITKFFRKHFSRNSQTTVDSN